MELDPSFFLDLELTTPKANVLSHLLAHLDKCSKKEYSRLSDQTTYTYFLLRTKDFPNDSHVQSIFSRKVAKAIAKLSLSFGPALVFFSMANR